jgi:hypothetical protein
MLCCNFYNYVNFIKITIINNIYIKNYNRSIFYIGMEYISMLTFDYYITYNILFSYVTIAKSLIINSFK